MGVAACLGWGFSSFLGAPLPLCSCFTTGHSRIAPLVAAVCACMCARAQVVYLIGWKPHESQPQPKARGSAIHSFKDIGRPSATSDDFKEDDSK